MTTASKNQARDLEADLAICEAATPGPWLIDEANKGVMSIGDQEGFEITTDILRDEDAVFIAEAREGWPYAIRRALEAEAEVDRLRAENAMLLEALNQRGCEL